MTIIRCKKCIYIYTLILIILTINSKAQYYHTGVESFKTDWKKREYKNIRLIYPAETDSIANQYLSALAKSDSLNDIDYNLGTRKIDVVLHPNTVLSNGFVAWAPRRMELVTQPDVQGDALLWHKTLSVHEMRHVKQMYALNGGTTKVLSLLFGQQAVGFASSFVHPWIFEGDAVWAETNYSFGGRGRSATFFNHYYTHSVSGQKPYLYDKWLLGSYKDFIPNHYQFGYQLVNYINHKWGTSTIPKTYRYVGRYPFTIFPTYLGLKKFTGLSRKNIYQKAFSYNDSLWLANYSVHGSKELPKIAKEEFKNLLYPYPLTDSTTIVYLTSLSDTPCFAIMGSSGEIKKLISTGILIGQPSYTDSLIVWAEYQPHARWEWMSSSAIKVYNFKTKHLSTITGGRFHSPIIDRDRIICIEYSSNGRYKLVGLNFRGEKSTLLNFEAGYEVQQICLDTHNKNIYGIAVSESGKKIFKVDSTLAFEIIYNAAYRDIRTLSCHGSNLFFSFTDGYTENIYSYDIENSIVYKITNLPPNSSYPTLKNQQLYFVHYTVNGYRLAFLSDIISNRKIENNISPYNEVVKVNSKTIHDSSVKIQSEQTEFKGLKALVNVHSWFPFYTKPLTDPANIDDESNIYPGVTLLSQNLTGTTLFNVGYGYGRSHLLFAEVTYNGLWPIFRLNFEQTDAPASLYRVTQFYPENRDYFKKAELTTVFPFTLSGGLYSSSVQMYNKISFNNTYLYNESINAYRSGLYLNDVGFTYFSLRRMAHRDLQPRLGLIFNAGLLATPWDYSNLANLWYSQTKIYLPGLHKNHGLSITLLAQKQNIKYIYLNNKVNFPPFYASSPSTRFTGMYFNYIMPVLYPDKPISSLVYLKRLSLNLFADFAKNSYKTYQFNGLVTLTDNLQSIGFDAIVDFHLFRTWYPFRIRFTQAFNGTDFNAYSDIAITINLYSTFARPKL